VSLHPDRTGVPSAEKGQLLALLHGLYSQRVRQPIEERFAEALREAMWTGLGRAYSELLDEHAIRRAARALATVEIVETQIDLVGIEELSDRVMRDYERASKQVDRWLSALGMTPAARAKLGVDVVRAADLVEALEQRRRQRGDDA
jgi:hypothetical protein